MTSHPVRGSFLVRGIHRESEESCAIGVEGIDVVAVITTGPAEISVWRSQLQPCILLSIWSGARLATWLSAVFAGREADGA